MGKPRVKGRGSRGHPRFIRAGSEDNAVAGNNGHEPVAWQLTFTRAVANPNMMSSVIVPRHWYPYRERSDRTTKREGYSAQHNYSSTKIKRATSAYIRAVSNGTTFAALKEEGGVAGKSPYETIQPLAFLLVSVVHTQIRRNNVFRSSQATDARYSAERRL